MATCILCKKTDSVQQNVIYKTPGQGMPIDLCRSHDHELFLIGQYRFVKKYEDKLPASYQIEDKRRKNGGGQDAA